MPQLNRSKNKTKRGETITLLFEEFDISEEEAKNITMEVYSLRLNLPSMEEIIHKLLPRLTGAEKWKVRELGRQWAESQLIAAIRVR